MIPYTYSGFFRAKVVDNNDPEKFGRILVYIPDIMPNIDDNKGIWARPANNPIGGRNSEGGSDNHFAGTSYIPPKDSWVWIFFEKNNPNRPYYFGSLDIQNTEVLPECRLGDNPSEKWIILKSHDGRCILISDDPSDARTEITGKKRKITDSPSGDTDSVYIIDENQTTILFDERDGKEKILIRTYKGDFFHVDIDEQKLQAYFKNGIDLKTDGDFNILAKNVNLRSTEDLNIYSSENLSLQSLDDTNFKSNANLNIQSVQNLNLKSGSLLNGQATSILSLKSGAVIASDAPLIADNGGQSQPAGSASAASATKADPKGERNT